MGFIFTETVILFFFKSNVRNVSRRASIIVKPQRPHPFYFEWQVYFIGAESIEATFIDGCGGHTSFTDADRYWGHTFNRTYRDRNHIFFTPTNRYWSHASFTKTEGTVATSPLLRLYRYRGHISFSVSDIYWSHASFSETERYWGHASYTKMEGTVATYPSLGLTMWQATPPLHWLNALWIRGKNPLIT